LSTWWALEGSGLSGSSPPAHAQWCTGLTVRALPYVHAWWRACCTHGRTSPISAGPAPAHRLRSAPAGSYGGRAALVKHQHHTCIAPAQHLGIAGRVPAPHLQNCMLTWRTCIAAHVLTCMAAHQHHTYMAENTGAPA